jgi:hypothetical protein
MMELKIATEADNRAVTAFFESFTLRGLVDLKPDRGQDFFNFYKAQSNEYRTYLLKDGEEILALASFIVRETFFEGKPVRIAYACDLRVSPVRKAIMEWTKYFLPVMAEIEKDFRVEHIFSVINLTEPSALNTFIRPRNMRRPLPRYYLYRKFNLVTINGRFPWAHRPLKHLRIRQGSPGNADALINYLTTRAEYKPFTSVWNGESLEKKFSSLPNFNLANFLVAFDNDENVVGCLAPWSPRKVQELVPLSYSLRAHNFRQFLKFARFLGWTRPLSKPVASTGREAPLNYRILTHLHAHNEDIFENLLYAAYEQASKDEFLIYSHVEQDFKLSPPPGWISASIPHALYSVVSPEKSMPNYLHPSIFLNPELEPLYLA